jgi:urea transporter
MKKTLIDSLKGVLRAYSAIVFLQKPRAGFIVLAATMSIPNLGLSGLIAALVGIIVARLLNFPYINSGMHIYNSLLVGLSLGAFYSLDVNLALLIVLGAILTVFVTVMLSSVLWRYDALPVLSLPFVIVAMTLAFSARNFGDLIFFTPIESWGSSLVSGYPDVFLTTMGAIYFFTQPLVGVVIITLILIYSRYLVFLALCGFSVGYGLLILLSDEMPANLVSWNGFNFALTAMAVGGIFTIPGWASFGLAMVAAAFAALVTTAMYNFLFGYGLPVMAFPFILTSLTIMAALRRRVSVFPPHIAPVPDLPERNAERARLARVRNGGPDSVAILAPFLGEWDIYQGFDGKYTHYSAWRYALDFYMVEEGRSFSGAGDRLEDFHCFGVPVISPVYGTITRIQQALDDNAPGEMDVQNNWGNFVLIGLDDGNYVLLAHLQHNSVKVKEGQRVKPGDRLAKCGNSGRSPQPHLHLQVQSDAVLGSATIPFHLASVIVTDSEQAAVYHVVAVPEVGERVQPARDDESLASNLHLPVGRCLTYTVTDDADVTAEQTFHVDVTLTGIYRFVSDSGAAACFQEGNGVLAFYDRTGPADRVLDAWLLANGLTPLSERAESWSDAPSAVLMPLTGWQRLLCALRFPMGAGLESEYRRSWSEDEQCWWQMATHRLTIFGAIHTARTEAQFDPDHGCASFTLESAGKRLQARLVNVGLMEDQGIPGWQEPFSG